MNTLREALDQLEKAKQMLSKAIEESLKLPSILDGKVAIQVNNEREFKLLMEHYESKGWKTDIMRCEPTSLDFDMNRRSVRYEDNFGTSHNCKYHANGGYKIIPFSDFAKEAGITPPVLIMKSEDGVDLYHKDNFYWTILKENKKYMSPVLSVFNVPEKPREMIVFSTREAAEKWIEEMNKPKEIVLDDTPMVKINIEGVTFSSNIDYMFSERLKEIHKAYRSLE